MLEIPSLCSHLVFVFCLEFLLQAPVKVHVSIQDPKLEKVFESFAFISKEMNWMLNNQIFRTLHVYRPPRNFTFLSFQNQNRKSRLRLKIQVYTYIYVHMCVGGVCVHSLTPPRVYIFIYMEHNRKSLFHM